MGIVNNIMYAPIGMFAIGRLIGSSSSSIKNLCVYSNIRPKSGHKPLDINTPQIVTEAQKKSINYGHNLTSYTTLPALIREVMSGGAFTYNKPSATAFGRFTDFEYYNQTPNSYWIKFVPNSTQVTSTSRVNFSVEGFEVINSDPSALLELFTWAYLSGYSAELGNMNLGLAMSKSPFTTSTASCEYIPISGELTISDIVGNDKIGVTLPSIDNGTWYIMPVLTTATIPSFEPNTMYHMNESSTGYFWFPLPFVEVSQIEVTTAINPINLISLSKSSFVVSDTAAPCYLTSITIDVVNGSTSAATGVGIDVYIATSMNTSGWVYTLVGSKSLGTIAANSSAQSTITCNVYIEEGYGAVKVDLTCNLGTKTNIGLGTVLEK